MYTVMIPDNNLVKEIKTETLKDAIKEKLAMEVNRLDFVKAVIFDHDGRIVSTRHQALYIIQNLV